MDRREREAILGEHGVYGENPRERSFVRKLDGDLEGSPLRGKPLPRRLRNFRPAVDAYVAGLHGLPRHLERLRQIEALSAEHEGRLAEAWERLAMRHARDPAGFARAWHRLAERWNFGAVNELIDRHNRWYPAEARLPMDPRTGNFVLVDDKPYRRRELDADWVLERFPPELERAA
jgi:hypothetical protein